MRFFGVLLLTAFLASTLPAQQPAQVRAVATVMQLHEAMIGPASDAVFNAGAQPPKDDKAWGEVLNQAIILAESGNLLMLGSRAKDQGDWMKMSRALVDAGALAVKAAQEKNAAALNDAGDRIESTCESCHQPYRDHGRSMMSK
jgi:hypothetical protein